MNSAIKFTSLFTFFFWSLQLSAQQEPVSTLFWNNYMHTNPAMTGAVYQHSANVVWRDYWFKPVHNVPYQTTVWANYALRINTINSGLGISYRYDVVGHQKMNTALLSYAYHIPVKSLFLSIGASAGIGVLNYDYSDFSFESPVLEPSFNPVFTSDFGIALRHEKWNVGLSVTQLNSATFRATDMQYEHTFTLTPHFRLFGDYCFDLGDKWALTPRVQLVATRQQLLTNLQLMATWNKNLWFGAGVKNAFYGGSLITVSPFVGYDVKSKFRIGYAANISTLPDGYMNNYMTHELVLSFLMK